MDLNLALWTVILFVPLVWLVRQVHEGLQELFFLLTGDKAMAVYLFQVLLLPGVALHEFSHYLTAKVLGVRVRSVSLRPKVQSGKIQMGAVAMTKPDFLRGVLIGMAPLLFGTAAILLIGHHVFDVGAVLAAAKSNDVGGMIRGIGSVFSANDAWIWMYLVFAVSNAMLPSESDRESLWPTAVFVAIIIAGAVLAGFGPALTSGLANAMETALSVLLVAFAITVFVDVIFVLVIWLLRTAASYLTGRRLDRTVS